MEFSKQKKQCLENIDLSRKGSIDEHILTLVTLINSQPQYFTTSSCSGRVVLFENESENAKDSKIQKRGCKWLFVTHEQADLQETMNALETLTHEAVLKFEPMIMHIQCETLTAAQQMHQVAVAAGFRNSGITVGKKGKTMVAVRSTHGLEAPLSVDGRLLVTKEYIEYLIESANKKMEINLKMIERYLQGVISLTERKTEAPVQKLPKEKKIHPEKKSEKQSEKQPIEDFTEMSSLLSLFDNS